MRVEHLAEGVTLYNADCRDILPTLGKVDAVVTDPPYRLTSGGKTPSGMAGGFFDNYSNNGQLVRCDIEWAEWIPLVCRSFEDSADLYIMANDKNLLPALRSVSDAGLGIHNVLVWDKVNATQNRWYMKNLEFTVYAWFGRARTIRDPSAKQLIRMPQVDETQHPTEKPVPLMEYYIRNSTDRGMTVLDPFVGTGTTGVASVKLGRKFIGIEIEPRYFDIACKRISDALKQPDMFVERPAPAKQEALDLS